MSVILRLQHLPWTANAMDIRRFFHNLQIPDGGVHIVGGDNGDAFIAFSTDEDARKAMQLDNMKINDHPVKILLSSKNEMQTVIAMARGAMSAPVEQPKPDQVAVTLPFELPSAALLSQLTPGLIASAAGIIPTSGIMQTPGMMPAAGIIPTTAMQLPASYNPAIMLPARDAFGRDMAAIGKPPVEHMEVGKPALERPPFRDFPPMQAEHQKPRQQPPNRGGAPPPGMPGMPGFGESPDYLQMYRPPGPGRPPFDGPPQSHLSEPPHQHQLPPHMRDRPQNPPEGMPPKPLRGSPGPEGLMFNPYGPPRSGPGPEFGRPHSDSPDHPPGPGHRMQEPGPQGRERSRFGPPNDGPPHRPPHDNMFVPDDHPGQMPPHRRRPPHDDPHDPPKPWDKPRRDSPHRDSPSRHPDFNMNDQNWPPFGGPPRDQEHPGRRPPGGPQPPPKHGLLPTPKQSAMPSPGHGPGFPDRPPMQDERPPPGFRDRPPGRQFPPRDYQEEEQFPHNQDQMNQRQRGFDRSPFDQFEDDRRMQGDMPPGPPRNGPPGPNLPWRDRSPLRGNRADRDREDRGPEMERDHERRDRGGYERGRGGPPPRRQVNEAPFGGVRDNDGPNIYVYMSNMSRSVAYKDIRRFFPGLDIPPDGIKLINDRHGSRIGSAFVKFAQEKDMEAGLARDGQHMRDKKVRINKSSQRDFEDAVDSFVPASDRGRSPDRRGRRRSPSSKKPRRSTSRDRSHRDRERRSKSPRPRPEIDENCIAVKNVSLKVKRSNLKDFFHPLRIGNRCYLEHPEENHENVGTLFIDFTSNRDFRDSLKYTKKTFMDFEIEITSVHKEDLRRLVSQHKANEKVGFVFRDLYEEDKSRDKSDDKKVNRGEGESSRHHDRDNDFRRSDRSSRNPPSPYVRIDGLPYNATFKMVQDFFHGCKIAWRGIHIALDSRGQASGHAFIEFVSVEDTMTALERNKEYMGRRYIEVAPITRDVMERELKEINTAQIGMHNDQMGGGPQDMYDGPDTPDGARGPPDGRDSRGPMDFRGPPDQRGPPDRRGPQDFQGPQDHRGPPRFRGPQDNRGPPDRRGPPDHRGPPDQRGPSDFRGGPDRRGHPDHRDQGPPDHDMPPDFQGPSDYDEFSDNMLPPDERFQPDLQGPSDHMGPPDRRGPMDRRGPSEMRGRPDQRGPQDHRGPPDHRGPMDHGGPQDFHGPSDQRGPPFPRGPHGPHMMGPRGPFGPRPPMMGGPRNGPFPRMPLNMNGPGPRLFKVGGRNFPYKTTEGDIMDFFKDFNPIPGSYQPMLVEGKPTGKALVAFSDKVAADMAVEALNNTDCSGRTVSLYHM